MGTLDLSSVPYNDQVNKRHSLMYHISSHYSATCEVSEDFNLDEYLTSLCDFITNHFDDLSNDLQDILGDMTYDETHAEFKQYVSHTKSVNRAYIQYNSEESNGNIVIWDWMCDNIREDVMTSPFMKCHYTTDNSRLGIEVGTNYILKDGSYVDVDAVLTQYYKMSA